MLYMPINKFVLVTWERNIADILGAMGPMLDLDNASIVSSGLFFRVFLALKILQNKQVFYCVILTAF